MTLGYNINYLLKVFSAINQTTNLILLITLFAALMVVILSIVISQSIVKPVQEITHAASLLALGDVNLAITLHSKDEIGRMADAFRAMIQYLQTAAGVAKRLASGDLTTKVVVVSDQDVLGQAFTEMTDTMHASISDITANANLLNEVSSQLALPASQAYKATSQIATTI
jgi:methyl-accepting chemotaxis protein